MGNAGSSAEDDSYESGFEDGIQASAALTGYQRFELQYHAEKKAREAEIKQQLQKHKRLLDELARVCERLAQSRSVGRPDDYEEAVDALSDRFMEVLSKLPNVIIRYFFVCGNQNFYC
jgi:hypothetical protein